MSNWYSYPIQFLSMPVLLTVTLYPICMASSLFSALTAVAFLDCNLAVCFPAHILPAHILPAHILLAACRLFMLALVVFLQITTPLVIAHASKGPPPTYLMYVVPSTDRVSALRCRDKKLRVLFALANSTLCHTVPK